MHVEALVQAYALAKQSQFPRLRSARRAHAHAAQACTVPFRACRTVWIPANLQSASQWVIERFWRTRALPPFCTDIGSKPIMMLAAQIQPFWVLPW